ncbi:MAG TPA: biopolymer transporter ExbD [Candidatus Eisenbacteria bacterium]|nr:biopolymer transporter ExbD [Candidatus Eisenbacteria bacterium]
MRRGKRGVKAPEGIHDVNMTPLIDVSLVLVVILMVATPMAFQSSIAVQRAAKSGQKADLVAHAERIEIQIVSADSLTVNRAPVPRNKIEFTLRPLLERSATRTVIVRCADGVPHGTFVGILDEAKRCGAADIAVVGG